MRLLRRSSDGRLSLTNDYSDEDEIPSYAILSHTWGVDGDEVTLEDLVDGTSKAKPGYEKIRFCSEQAQHDSLEHFWVDTCCIDKTDKAELSKAIQSMFRWYRNAARCYVYLPDVSTPLLGPELGAHILLWEPQFRKSRWFTRGWTLQELLAPSSVEFFSREGQRLGDKRSLREQIHRITNIPYAAIDGAPLSQFTVNERLQWKEHRETKHEEDGAYSLLGIFDVYLAPLYGEGAAGAFRRLIDEIQKQERCIQDIRSTDPRDDKKRIEDAKGGLLKDSYRWVLDNTSFQQWHNDPQSQLLWVKGDPGKGKTMLLCGIIDELQKATVRTVCVSYFFCQATDSRINSATAVLRGLLYLLVSQQPSLISHVRKKHDHAGKTMFEDVNAWVTLTEIFADVLRDPSLSPTHLLIDALDECVTDLPKLLDFVAKQSSVSSCVKWIVSSRNWPGIEEQLEHAGQRVRLSLELNAASVSTAVSVFIEQRVSQLARQQKYDKQTKDTVLEYLTSNANDTFLWVALACQNLQATARRNAVKKLRSFPPGLDALYERMMQQIGESDDAELCKQLLALVALVYRPIILQELVALAEQLDDDIADESELLEIIGLCGSFLTLQGETIYFVHQSAQDFLLTKAVAEVFPSGMEAVHYAIFARSLQAMSKTLRRDVYGLHELGFSVEDVKQPNPDPLGSSRYSCIYWIDHLRQSDPICSATYKQAVQDEGAVHAFLRESYLHWLEALSLCRSISKGVLCVAKLRSLVENSEKATSLVTLINDAYRFIMYHKGAIEGTPLQVYASALLFSPARSLVRLLYKHEEPAWVTVKPAMSDNWSACLQTLEGHSGGVNFVVFSHDSTKLASASWDETIKMWDASSGTCLQTLEGHSDRVHSIAFSHDSTKLASASSDRTIKMWDVSSGACLQTLKGHSELVFSIVFSHDSTKLASASGDMTIKIWNGNSGACLQTLKGHSDQVHSIAFSHNSTKLASASGDMTIKIWDIISSACLHTLENHSYSVRSIAFSHDSAKLASASYDKTIKIWDAGSGACLQTLEGHSESVNSVAFSHESIKLASASDDNTVKVWDAHSGVCLQTLEGHSSYVKSVAFSHNLSIIASASADKTVKIWNTNSGACPQMLKGHSGTVNSIASSHDSSKLASASDDNTVKVWNAGSGACLQTLEGHSRNFNSIAFSHDSSKLASASDDNTVKVWDIGSGTCLQTLEGHITWVNSIAFSHDSIKLASASWDTTIKVWDVNSGVCMHTLEGHGHSVRSVAFSHDSAKLASASDDKTVKVWDASSGACLQTLNIGKTLGSLSFDCTDSYLLTERGIFALDSSTTLSKTPIAEPIAEPKRALCLGVGLSKDKTWIQHDGKNILWIPSEYRPSCSVVYGTTVGMGAGSGRVWLCNISTADVSTYT